MKEQKIGNLAPVTPITPQQRRLRIFIVVSGILLFCAYTFTDPILRGYSKYDLQGIKARQGIAIVETMEPAGPDIMGKPQPSFVVVKFHNALCQTGKVLNYKDLRLHAPARITYRVGRSGHIYVDEVEPLQ